MSTNNAQSLSTSPLPTLNDVDVRDQRVLLRVDYNIGVQPDGTFDDTYRMEATLPTLRYLLQNGARVGILTHLGRPGGRIVPKLSTAPLAHKLSHMLGQPVQHIADCVGRMAEDAMNNLPPGHVLMLENVRFHLGEQLNQASFVRELTRLGDIFVNDAFATAHRAHASTSGLAAAMPHSVVGRLMEQELEWLRRIAFYAERPLALVLGGSAVDIKLELLRKMLGRAETVMLGGAVANTFMAARDLGLGQSLLSPAHVDAARELLTEAGVVGCRLHLPQDVWVQNAADPSQPAQLRPTHAIGSNEMVVDIGSHTLDTWKRVITHAKTTLFVGSLGINENPEGQRGSLGLLQALCEQPGFNLVGGTGMLPLLHANNLLERLPAVSTGGASLVDGLAGKSFPCLQVLAGRV